jgi:hypothetical protein
MQTRDTFAMGLRSLKERPLETGLIILGITLASCVAAASLLLLLSQKAQSDKILQGPAYREILVSSASDSGQNARSGITLVNQQAAQSFQLSASDLSAAGSTVPQLAFGYRADNTRFRAGNFGGRGGGGNFAVRVTNGGDAPAPAAAPVATGAVAPNQVGPGGPGGGGPARAFGFQPEAIPEGVTLIKPTATDFNGVNANPSFFLAYGVSAGQGSLFTDDDAVNNAAVLVLGPNLAKNLYPDLTAEKLVGQKTQLNGRIYTIVGVLENSSAGLSLANGNSLADLAFAPIRQQNFGFAPGAPGEGGGFGGNFGQTRNLRFAVAKVADLKEASAALTKFFDAKYGEGKVAITVPFEAAQLSQSGFERLLWIIVAFGVGTLVMALINLMNMMLTRALRRQTAMGILAAMGANRQTLAALQGVEGGLMALAGTVIGVVLAIPLYGLLYQAGRNLFNLQTKASFDWAALSMVTPGLLIVTLLLAFLPAWQTSRIEITTALRAE